MAAAQLRALITSCRTAPGRVVYSAVNTYTDPTFLNGGYSVISADSGFGTPSSAAVVNLNGGTVVGNATFALDNNAANLRPFTLLANGGGFAAAAGTIMTVDGQVGSAPGTGPLIIGIPASAANGNVAGLLPGSGPNSANLTPVYGTGTVVLNNTAGNYYYGGTVILGGATLNINGNWALGGSNYLGGLTFNGGVLQYNTTLNSSPDISQSSTGIPQKVTFAGWATIDVNGTTVTYANSVGNGGAGTLTVTNSGSSGVGGLFLNGGSTHTGGTLVTSGAVLGGTNTIAGNVTWNSGSFAALTQGLPLTVTGTVTFNSPTVQLIASGLTAGTYTLLTATGGFTAGSSVNLIPIGTGAIANGYGGTLAINGNSLVLTVVQLGVAATWTDGLGDQNWSEAGNWFGGVVPHNPGDAATFGTSANPQVNLNQNETVGGVTFNNSGSYTISGANTLTMDNKGNGISFFVTAGTANAINSALTLNGSVIATVGTGDSLTLGGIIANESTPESITAAGGGTLAINNANTYGPAAHGGHDPERCDPARGQQLGAGCGRCECHRQQHAGGGRGGLEPAEQYRGGKRPHPLGLRQRQHADAGRRHRRQWHAGLVGRGRRDPRSVNNTYAGGTTLNGGVLSISAEGAATGSPASLGVVPALVAGNNLLFNGGDLLATATLSLNANRGLGIGATSPFNTAITTALIDAAAGATLTIAGNITSAGNTGVNNLTVNSQPGNTGIVVLGGTTPSTARNIISAGTEQLAGPLGLQNAILYYNNQGGRLDFGTKTAATLGGLIGSQNLTLANDTPAAVALTIGNNTGTPFLYTGTLADNGGGGSLILNGSGTEQIGSGSLGGANYTGGTTLNEGTLILGGNTALTARHDHPERS